MQRLSGRLQESNHRGLFPEEVWAQYFMKHDLLYAISKLRHVY